MLKKSLIAAVLACALVAGGWCAAQRLESPEQVAARAAPPAPGPVLVAVEAGYLHGRVTLAATAEAAHSREVSPTVAMSGVVTAQVAHEGDDVSAGSVLLRVDGRPVFAMPGKFGLYRDIAPGDTGDDVHLLQVGLAAAGLYSGAADGVYGRGTQAAINQMYANAGYVAPRAEPGSEPGGEPANAPKPQDSDADAAPREEVRKPATGPMVLRSEVLVVGDLPATVDSLASVGTILSSDAPLISLSSGQTVLAVTVPSPAASALAKGALATFAADKPTKGTASVQRITTLDDAEARIVFAVKSGEVTVGAQYTLALDNPANEPNSRLLVPVTSIIARGGRTYVNVRTPEGFTELAVSVDGQEAGVAAITSAGGAGASADLLAAGAQVRVGTDGQ